MSTKGATNPKGVAGKKKYYHSVIPRRVLAELSLGMLDGALKYKPYNWRDGPLIEAEDYFNAVNRHLDAWWEGEDFDPDAKEAKIHHITKAITTLIVLLDATLMERVVDNRPTSTNPSGWVPGVNDRTQALLERPKPHEPDVKTNERRGRAGDWP